MQELSRFGGAEYRLGDYATGYLHKTAPRLNVSAFFCGVWPLSIACSVSHRIHGSKLSIARTIPIIEDVVRERSVFWASCKPKPGMLLIHLRLGDVFEWQKRYDCHSKISSNRACHYASTPAQIVSAISHIHPNTSIMIIGNPRYRSEALRHNGSKSLAYANNVQQHLRKRNFSVTANFDRDADCDLVALMHADRVVLSSHGKYALIARHLATRRGNDGIVV